MVILTINGIDIEVEHKPIKNLHLAVYPPNGRVHVSAPESYTKERVEIFVRKKMVWIMEKREELTSYDMQSEREFVSGEAHYFMGQLYRLKVIRDTKSVQHVERVGDYLNVYVRPAAEAQHIEAVLYAWYKEQVAPFIDDMVRKYGEIIGIMPEQWEVRKMQSRWGSCSMAKRKILFNIELAKKPKECIEYVVLHEMCHLKCRTHSKDFKRMLDQYFPDWINVKDKLNEFPL